MMSSLSYKLIKLTDLHKEKVLKIDTLIYVWNIRNRVYSLMMALCVRTFISH
ncbi:hypothetical protein J5U22_01992 [Saccharolobus shibatae]|uniref:Uncharacterized protein n=1 Tax=Saccharolobus shibatae TaxID=2286 RepID=A0A8F5GZT0_9CREN|nr:hypothetical protein J5U22_01992 [Saccharolobus shibatae]